MNDELQQQKIAFLATNGDGTPYADSVPSLSSLSLEALGAMIDRST
jgi:hypothetical protein